MLNPVSVVLCVCVCVCVFVCVCVCVCVCVYTHTHLCAYIHIKTSEATISILDIITKPEFRPSVAGNLFFLVSEPFEQI